MIKRREMMKYFIEVLALSILVCVFVISSPIEAENVSDAEESIKQTLSGYEKAWNKKDTKAVIAFYHDDADIMTGADRRIVSKKEYEKILAKRIRKFGKIKFDVPEITVSGDKAKVKVKVAFKRLHFNFTFYMVLQDNRWLIMVQEY